MDILVIATDAAGVFTRHVALGKGAPEMMERIELEKARQLIKERSSIPGIEKVGLLEAHGRVLAEDISAPIDQPPFNRSPLDGYALIAKDTKGASPSSPVSLEVIDTIYAGGYSRKKVTGGSAVRLMTGSPIPDGADCVIRQEDTRKEEGRVKILKQLSPWDNYCFKGENFKKGDLVLKKNHLLKAAEVGVLAGLGVAEVLVYQIPTAAVISTGDELVEPGVKLVPGQVYNSNFYTIASRLKECGVNVVSNGILGDDKSIIESTITEVINKVDFIITTGGVSVGEKDLMMEIMDNLGAEKIFWRINLKPGSPVLFSVLADKPVISLSGNPLAASVTFDLLLSPFLKEITRNNSLELKTLPAVLQNDFDKESPIRRALRGHFVQDENGKVFVRIVDLEQSPGNLKVVLDSNCYIDIEKGCSGLKQGELVQIII